MLKNFQQIWEQIATMIRLQVTPDTFQRWFAAVELQSMDDEALELCVPNNIYQLWIETNYMPMVQASIAGVLGATRRLRFVFPDCVASAKGEENGESSASASATPPKGSLVQLPTEGAFHSTSMKKSQVAEVGATEVAKSSSGVEASATSSAALGGMNPRYTFENFVVGSNCQFAQAASLAVADAPGKTYNPLFIYGGVGLGKTHLMQAIGQHVAKKKGAKVIYISSEKFTNEFIDAIQHSTLVKFRKKYRSADVLLIDDIQFLAGKERSQEEFFHTFNALFDGHKQIVLSSDRPPSEIANLESRMVSRFEWGLTAEIQVPDMETRLAILRKKADGMQVKLPASILEYLANRISTNVRRLEGALMRVASYASLSGQELTPEGMEKLLKDVLQEEARRSVTIEQIQKSVAEHYDVRISDMSSKRRPASIAFPRQIAMYLARELTKSSLSEIGSAFGGRDHGTVLHAYRAIKKKIQSEDEIRQTVSLLDSQIQSAGSRARAA